MNLQIEINEPVASQVLGREAWVGYGGSHRGKRYNEMVAAGRGVEYFAREAADKVDLIRKLELDFLTILPHAKEFTAPALIAENTWQYGDPSRGGEWYTGSMDNVEKYSTWAEVDLGAIENNIHLIGQKAGAPVMAVVKANAYGHGTVPAAQAALRGGASWCGVARIEEALELRAAGVYCPLLLLGYTPPARYADAIANQVSLTVWDSAHLEVATQTAARLGQTARLHLKVDTGMGRLGVQPEEAVELARRLAGTPGVLFEGLFTHYARADETDPAPTDQQERIFLDVIQALELARLLPPKVHAANSAASLYRPSSVFNLARAGIAMYGLHPSPECLLPSGFRQALSWKTVIGHVKTLPPGRGVSYGHEYVTRSHERIGTAPVGYADGIRRRQKHVVLVGGQRVEVVSRVCMDQIMLLLDNVPQARPGDEVVIVGSQGDECITAEEVAERWGTNNYEVVCGIGARVPRVYSGALV